VRLFKINLKGLAIGQIQQIGSVFFSQLTNILITFIAAQAVVTGDITLGMMMAITFILGQLSAPIDQFMSPLRKAIFLIQSPRSSCVARIA